MITTLEESEIRHLGNPMDNPIRTAIGHNVRGEAAAEFVAENLAGGWISWWRNKAAPMKPICSSFLAAVAFAVAVHAQTASVPKFEVDATWPKGFVEKATAGLGSIWDLELSPDQRFVF